MNFVMLDVEIKFNSPANATNSPANATNLRFVSPPVQQRSQERLVQRPYHTPQPPKAPKVLGFCLAFASRAPWSDTG